jgi:hypothetical protein
VKIARYFPMVGIEFCVLKQKLKPKFQFAQAYIVFCEGKIV